MLVHTFTRSGSLLKTETFGKSTRSASGASERVKERERQRERNTVKESTRASVVLLLLLVERARDRGGVLFFVLIYKYRLVNKC